MLFLSLFMTVFLFVYAIYLRKQMNTTEEENNTPIQKRALKTFLKESNQKLTLLLTKNKKRSKKKNSLAQKLSVAGVWIKPEEFIAFQWLAGLFLMGLLHLVSGQLLLSAVGFITGYFFPKLWINQKQKQRIRAFHDGLPNMLTSIIGSLKAGFSFPQALQMVAEESYSPIKDEVELMLKKMRYGTSLDDALKEWSERVPGEDIELLVEAISIQRQVGGNLAFLLQQIVETIRERSKIENQIKTLTAQGRLSGIIISILPVVLGVIIYIMNPDYMMTLFINPIGQFMLVAALTGGVIGFILIRKITTIEV
jgi:tight adherence protein B